MKYKVTLKGKVYEVEVERGEAMILDEYEAVAPSAPAVPAPAVPAPQAPVPAAPAGNINVSAGEQVKAPLPGNVLTLKVKVGDAVKSGDVLMLIEAMKMENEVLAPCNGSVKQILVSKGQTVATGDVLIVI